MKRVEQSGQSHCRVEARVSGGEERQVTCQAVVHVLQVSVDSGKGLSLHTMHTPSPSQGRSLLCAMEVGRCRISRE